MAKRKLSAKVRRCVHAIQRKGARGVDPFAVCVGKFGRGKRKRKKR